MPRGRKKGFKQPNKYKDVVMPPRNEDDNVIPGTLEMAKAIDCKCPRCEKIYKRLIYWSGNGMPRIYCPPCREAIKEYVVPDMISLSDPRAKHFLHRLDRVPLDSDWNP